jgi:hypothetical protein
LQCLSVDDLNVDLPAHARHPLAELRPLIATGCIELQQEWERAKKHAHQQHPAIAVLDIGRVQDGG